MIVKLRKDVSEESLSKFIKAIKDLGLSPSDLSSGNSEKLIGLIGDTAKLDINNFRKIDIVEDVIRIQEPYKKANRKFHPEDTIVELCNGVKIGGGNFQIMAGPCSVENEEQIIEVAKAVKEAGATILRGGAFKPRTSPYSFQGLGKDGIDLLLKAKEATGLPIVTEIMEISQLKYFEDVDMLQVGARNMQNFDLLKAVGATDKPVLLKRGLSATYEELLMSAEYIMASGNPNVVLCERGIRTFETETRNTLDITAIPYLKEKTHLPVIIDPSHAAGAAKFVRPLSLAGVGAGADGLMIEVHNDPSKALSDGPQALRPEEFDDVAKKVFSLRKAMEA
ncbi:MAG: 3-deoxy-7-phosphoheptulonate synthase [Anaerococcus sp.]|nr:3-deoxy-7-phosphoheptulonate synthase [Anaerococcus sp.]